MLEAVGQSQVNQQMMEMKTSTGGGGGGGSVQDKQFNLTASETAWGQADLTQKAESPKACAPLTTFPWSGS